jgi:translation initiation factor 2 subunit 3
MAKAKEILPTMNIGLIGHVDHGKTTLTQALSGKWTDTHSEEMKRGITIKLGYADIAIRHCPCGIYTTNEKCEMCGKKTNITRKVSLVDAPGHETLMAIMVSGAAIMDAAILMVAADEACPQPQTTEHLVALKILGIKSILIVQNKVDLVTEAEAKKNYDQIKKFAKEMLGFEVPVIPISAQKRVNIDLVIEAIEEFMPTPERDASKSPEFLIARSFDINKPGTSIADLHGGVIGGAIIDGIFKIGQEIEIRPGIRIEKQNQISWQPIKTKLKAIVVGSNFIDEKGPGGSIAFETELDSFVTKKDGLVGSIVGLPEKLPPIIDNISLEIELFEKILGIKEDIKVDPIKMNEPLMINSGTATTLGVTMQSSGNNVKLNLKRPICAHSGSKVAISRQIRNRWHLIGFGVIQ